MPYFLLLLYMAGAALPKKREIKSELVLSKIGKASTMNEIYNIPCFKGMLQFLLLLQMTGAALPKFKRKMKSELVSSKIRKATTMNEFYNIPCLH